MSTLVEFGTLWRMRTTTGRGGGRVGRPAGSPPNREAILAAARTQFAERGYENATIRGIAAGAGVDPALVHHYYGSKDQLFAAALRLPFSPREVVPQLLAGGVDELGEAVLRLLLDVWASDPSGGVLVGLVRSAISHEVAARMVREFFTVPDGPAPRRWRLTEPAGTPGRRTYADSMRLDEDQRALLSKARIGMLAISGRLPLVNPAAFHFGGDALWMTTSRHAAKLALIRRDPRAAFLVTPERRQRGHGVLLQGMLEAYDPRSVRSQVRAALQGPGFALSLAGYALKNVAFIGGYLMDLPRIPADWWPHNRVLLRLRPDRVGLVPPMRTPPAAPARPAGVPGQVAAVVARQRSAQLCWQASGRPLLASAAWALDGPDALAWLPAHVPGPPRDDAPAALVLEHHHPIRPTRMVGLCLRGRLVLEPAARAAIEERYDGPLPAEGTAVRLVVARSTWWRGFEVRSRPAVRPAPAPARVR